MLQVRSVHNFGFPILRVTGNLDLTTFGKLLAQLGHILEGEPRLLGLDLGEVNQADAAAVNLVATAAEWMAEHGGRLRLLDTSPAFERAVRENSSWLRPHSHLELKAAS